MIYKYLSNLRQIFQAFTLVTFIQFLVKRGDILDTALSTALPLVTEMNSVPVLVLAIL